MKDESSPVRDSLSLHPSAFILLFNFPLNKSAGWKRMAAPLQPILAEGLDDP